jgi:hypothetical protein
MVSLYKDTKSMLAKMDAATVIALVAAASLMIIGYILLLVGPENSTVPQSEVASILLHNLMPDPVLKPGDRLVFFGLVVSLPIVLLGVVMAARVWQPTLDALPLLIGVGIISTLVILLNGALWDSSIFGYVAITGLCYAAALRVVLPRSKDQAYVERMTMWFAFVLSFLVFAGLRIWTAHHIHYSGPYPEHYEAVAFAPVHIAGGATCLVDAIAQYGCYGEFIAPILRVLGSSTVVVTAVFALLQLIAAWAVFIFARTVIRTPSLLLACILCLFIEVVMNMRARSNDPILQYYPLRFIFPALSLLLCMWLQQRLTVYRILLAGLFGGAALAWNLETGLVVCIALGALITYGDFNSPLWKSGKNLLAGFWRGSVFVFGVAVFLAAFLYYLESKSGTQIDLARYVIFQKTFYFTGFGMILTPAFPDYWTMHAAIILAVLLWVALHVGKRVTIDPVLVRMAFLAILAIGLTLYYTGRSHPMVLKLVAWPDAILLLFLVDQALRSAALSVQRKRILQRIAIALPAAFLLMHVPNVAGHTLLPYWTWSQQTEVEQDIDFIKSHTTRGEAIGIVSLNQATLYGETGTIPALSGPGIPEIIRQAELAALHEEIIAHGPEKLFIGAGLDKPTAIVVEIPLDFSRIYARYTLVEKGPNGRLLYLKRKS